MRVGILTSSRADYGIYLPLLQKMKKDSFFELEIIVFGTHLSKIHGYTIEEIQKDGYALIHTISSLLSNDDEQAVATSYGLTALKFAEFWANNQYETVFCLGDRFEMSAAVQAGIPFGVHFSHIHGGETTLGAIDNIYRHQITLASRLHFTSTEIYTKKIINLLGENNNIHTVGSLSLDEIKSYKPIEKNEFFQKFNLKDRDFALVTFHPETMSGKQNNCFANEMKDALKEVSNVMNLVITMPNADTLGSVFRKKIEELKAEIPCQVTLIESFGKVNYFSAMYYSKVLIGNTSSGIIEAASFGKYIINVGDRQKGRAQSMNIIDATFNADEILIKTKEALKLGLFKEKNIYFIEGAADSIINIIKNHAKL